MSNVVRKGNCFEDSVNKLIQMRDPRAMVVHGLPMGQGGEAGKYGRYPHSWVELDGMVWESSIDDWLPAYRFYELGQIEFTQRYAMKEVRDLLALEDATFGPWCDELINRDKEIEVMAS